MSRNTTIETENKRIPTIDYLRGFSIFTIVLMHLLLAMTAVPSKVQTAALAGGTGVHVFFLCSGTGLYLSYLNKKVSFAAFLRKRFLKIYVPYIIVVFFSFLLPWAYSGDNRFTALLSHVFLFKMFFVQYEESFGTHFWYISTIIQLYLLFVPMCMIKEKIRDSRIFFGVFLSISIIWWVICYALGVSEIRVWSSFCFQYIWEFALGLIIAEALRNGTRFHINNLILLVVAAAGIGIQAGLAMKAGALKVFNDIPALLGYTALALLLMNISIIRKAAVWLSKISYEFYLVHFMIIVSAFHFLKPTGLVQQGLVGTAAVILALLSAYFYHLVILKLLSKQEPFSNTGENDGVTAV